MTNGLHRHEYVHFPARHIFPSLSILSKSCALLPGNTNGLLKDCHYTNLMEMICVQEVSPKESPNERKYNSISDQKLINEEGNIENEAIKRNSS